MLKNIDSFLVKERGQFSLFFCRGPGKCTKSESQKWRMSRLKQKCQDCLKGEDHQTIGEVATKLERGDA